MKKHKKELWINPLSCGRGGGEVLASEICAYGI